MALHGCRIGLYGSSVSATFMGMRRSAAGIYGYNPSRNSWSLLSDSFVGTTAGVIGTNGTAFLAGRGTTSQELALSAAGFTFAAPYTPSFTRLNNIFRFGSSFLVTYLVAGAAYHSLTSSDGVTFSNDNTLTDFSPRGFAAIGNKGVLAGADGNGQSGRLWVTTSAGGTFSNVTSQPFQSTTDSINAAAASSTAFIVAGSNLGATAGRITRSTDPANSFSSYITNPITSSIRAIAYANGVFVAGGNSGQVCRSTDDGLTWGSLISNPFSVAGTTITNIVTDGEIFLAYGSSKYAISPDGSTWYGLFDTPVAFDGGLA